MVIRLYYIPSSLSQNDIQPRRSGQSSPENMEILANFSGHLGGGAIAATLDMFCAALEEPPSPPNEATLIGLSGRLVLGLDTPFLSMIFLVVVRILTPSIERSGIKPLFALSTVIEDIWHRCQISKNGVIPGFVKEQAGLTPSFGNRSYVPRSCNSAGRIL